MSPSEGRARVLILWLGSELEHVARVRRQIDSLADHFDVILATPDRPPRLADGVEFVELGPVLGRRAWTRIQPVVRSMLRWAGSYSRAFWLDTVLRRRRQELSGISCDAVLVNELAVLPLAFGIADPRGTPVIFDAHEHWTSESASWTRRQRLTMRRAHDWIVDTFVPRVSGLLVVSQGIADDYEQRTGVRPLLVTNAPFFQPLEPSLVEEPIRLLHVGIADERRRLEDTISAVRSLDGRFTLDLILMRENAYRRRLERMIENEPRIRILPPVASDDLIRLANGYDVGVFLLPPRFPNQVHVLPNKLFDYIQARLAVAVGPNREMAEVVREWDCGVISESFDPADLAAALSSLTVAEVKRLKTNADRAAHVLTANRNRDRLVELVSKVVGDS